MTNLRAEKTRRRTDDDLVPQGFVAVHTLKPLSCVVTFFYSEISFNNNGPRAGKNSIRLFPYDPVWFRIRCHVTHYSNFLPSTLLQLRREQLAPKAVLEHQNDNPWE